LIEYVTLRQWRGWTTPGDADRYEAIVRDVLAEIAGRGIDGYRGAYLVRRELAGEVEFGTLLLFDSMESVRVFAGHEDYEAAYVPEHAREVLSRFDERSAHFEVLLEPEGGS
jgi:heme-degrading monooxygenase HmoA